MKDIPKGLCSPGDPKVTSGSSPKCELGVPPFVLLSLLSACVVVIVVEVEVEELLLQKGSMK